MQLIIDNKSESLFLGHQQLIVLAICILLMHPCMHGLWTDILEIEIILSLII